jgi:hypothetical protein
MSIKTATMLVGKIISCGPTRSVDPDSLMEV